MRRMNVLFASLFALMFASFYGLVLQSVPIELNKLMSIKSIKFDKRALWTHAGSRDVETNTGAVGNNSSGRSKGRAETVASPENHHEILIGTSNAKDVRDKNGNNFFVIQSVDYPGRVGSVYYNEPIKIISMVSGPGIKTEAGVQPKPRVWWVHHPARHFPEYCEVIVSFPESKHIIESEKFTHFAFVSPVGKTGKIQEGDPVKIKSLSGDPKSDQAFLWVYPESRWGKGYQELLIRKGDDRVGTHGEFELQNISRETLIEPGKKMYDSVFVPASYNFLKLTRDLPSDLKTAWEGLAEAKVKLKQAKMEFEKNKGEPGKKAVKKKTKKRKKGKKGRKGKKGKKGRKGKKGKKGRKGKKGKKGKKNKK